MNTNMEINKTVIFHAPYGEQDPYGRLPWERSPRDPSEADAVLLGVRTQKDVPVDHVYCEWQVNDGQVGRLQAQKLRDDDEYEYWQVVLPALQALDRVRYRFLAVRYEELYATPHFEFTVNQWVTITSVCNIRTSADSLQALVVDEGISHSFSLQVDFPNNDEVRFALVEGSVEESLKQEIAQEVVAFDGHNVTIEFSSEPFQCKLIRDQDGLEIICSSIKVLLDANGNILKYALGFQSPREEAFYGFGERFNALDQRGNTLINRVYQKYTRQGKRSYLPIPFFLSSRGYGMWLRTERWAEFDLAWQDADSWSVLCEAEGNDQPTQFSFLLKEKLLDNVAMFTDLVGKPTLPPPWAFGLWISSNDWNSQAEIMRQLRLSREHAILPSVVVIEAWSDEITFYIWNDAQYDAKPSGEAYSYNDYRFPVEGKWPDPKGMVDAIHEMDAHLVLWQIPVFKLAVPEQGLDETQKMADQEYAVQKNYVVRSADGSVHEIEAHMPWFTGGLVHDFSNPAARKWWVAKRAYLLSDIGVDGFKTDGGEHVWDKQAIFHEGMRGDRGINLFPNFYLQAYRELLEDQRQTKQEGPADRVLFSRAGYTGVQQYSCHWSGDELSTWEGYRASLRAMLNAALGGVSFMGWDIAGFAGELPSSDLYLRAVAFSTFCPIMQYHSDFNLRRKPSRDRTPWNMQEQTGDEHIIPIFRFFSNVRMNLMPYLLSQAWLSNQNGLPLMRALPVCFQDDAACRQYPYQYMFGDALLIAPVVTPGVEELQVYLPEGEWQHIWDGNIYQGPTTISLTVARDRIPVFQKKGSVLPLNLGDDLKLGSFVGNKTDAYQNLVLRIYPQGEQRIPLYSGKDGALEWVEIISGEDAHEFTVELPAHKTPLIIDIIDREIDAVSKNGKLLETEVSEQGAVRIHLAADASQSKVVFRGK